MNDIFTSVTLLGGQRVDLLMVRGKHISRSSIVMQRNPELEMGILLMAEVCLVDGKQMPLEFYQEMMCDDYMTIMNALTDIITKITR